jgi:GxxExxY protein
MQGDKEFLYGNLTYKINGILYAVHRELGPYAREKQYGDLAETKFISEGVPYQREIRVGESGNILDFIAYGLIPLEFKAKPFLTKEDYYQIQRYLQILNLRLGLLVNFRTRRLIPKRILHPLGHP